jgi:large subunit ribosomal protein L5e
MTYIRLSKTSSYFSRFQVKYRRRREGKTDYRARLSLVTQDKNKYCTPKYRLVVRFSNKDIICQVIYSTIRGDNVVCSSYAHELPKYGLSVGLTNYSAAYCVGLLCARRCLSIFGLEKTYIGVEEPCGEDTTLEPVIERPRPFTVILDTGLNIASTGSRQFAVLKGSLDGGLDIPHNEKRFVGYDNTDKKFDPDILQRNIFGGHISDFMDELMEEEPDGFRRQFSHYIRHQIKSDQLEEMYTKVHSSIRATKIKSCTKVLS